jgi:regulator of sigma E protease
LHLAAVDGQIVGSYIEYQEAQLKKIGQTITCTFTRTASHPDQDRAAAMPPVETKEVEIPAVPMREIPVRFKMGTITAVLSGSSAEEQGIKEGDTIVSVDGKADIDPLKLPQILLRKINEEQKTVTLVIKKASGTEQTLTLELKPTRCLSDLTALSMQESLGSTALGLAWSVEPFIADVDESVLSPGQPVPAAGDRVIGVEFVNSAVLMKQGMSFIDSTEKGFAVHGIGSKVEIPYIFTFLLQHVQPQEPTKKNFSFLSRKAETQESKEGEKEKLLSVRLTLESSDGNTKIVDLPILEAADWFQLERGFDLKTDLTTFKAAGIGEALSLGTVRMIDYSLLVYKSVNALINGTVSAKALNGPVGIVIIIYQIAQGGWSEYLMLLCLIGANLAVINLLPIPPLDGGHVVFLLYEWIFRRSPNELVQVVLSYLGLFLIILLMVWTVSLDLSCISRW